MKLSHGTFLNKSYILWSLHHWKRHTYTHVLYTLTPDPPTLPEHAGSLCLASDTEKHTHPAIANITNPVHYTSPPRSSPLCTSWSFQCRLTTLKQSCFPAIVLFHKPNHLIANNDTSIYCRALVSEQCYTWHAHWWHAWCWSLAPPEVFEAQLHILIEFFWCYNVKLTIQSHHLRHFKLIENDKK